MNICRVNNDRCIVAVMRFGIAVVVLTALLDKGADKNAKDKEKLTAEKWALKGNHDETAKMLK